MNFYLNEIVTHSASNLIDADKFNNGEYELVNNHFELKEKKYITINPSNNIIVINEN